MERCELGIYTWPMVRHKGGWITPDTSPAAFAEWQVVKGLSEWKVVEFKVASPVHVYFERAKARRPQPPVSAVFVSATRKEYSVLAASAQAGFRGITVLYLKKMAEALGVDVRAEGAPRGVEAWVEAMARKMLPEASHNDIAKALLTRIESPSQRSSCLDMLEGLYARRSEARAGDLQCGETENAGAAAHGRVRPGR